MNDFRKNTENYTVDGSPKNKNCGEYVFMGPDFCSNFPDVRDGDRKLRTHAGIGLFMTPEEALDLGKLLVQAARHVMKSRTKEEEVSA